MSFQRYPAYKNSGVEWLGEVPEHWGMTRLRYNLEFVTSGARGWAENYSEEGDVFIRIANLTRDGIGLDLSSIQRVEVPNNAETARTRVKSGDVLFSITAFLGSVAVVPDDIGSAFVSQHVALARPNHKNLISRWIGYAALSVCGKTWFDSQSYGGTKIQLALDDVRNMPLPCPPIDEQIAIAAFLDRETAKIDALVAEQERLIALLKEKRQAVISHAVTKGLNPDAPMRDSGIEWLGQVPAHWDVRRLKNISELTVGIVVEPSKYYSDDGVPALRSLNVRQGAIKLDNLVYISHQGHELHSKSRLRAGDLVAVRSGQPGTTAVIPEALDGCNCVDLIVIRRPKRDSEHYLCWYLASDAALSQFSVGSGGAIQQHFNVASAAELWVSLPPRDEQEQIAKALDAKSTQLDCLVAEAERAIALLQERRSALISAAVTGQIDVRALEATA